MYKLVFSDLDETLLVGNDVPEVNREAIYKMQEKGVKFVYQPYEISYYAAGKPEFTIPYAAIRPYLTPQAVKLFLNNR